ncbi:hypothetical protein K438DRAFT_1754207 [Mycena galopus ATCC 62051]|nr:hypothetical protein K438DRAFT_1754207 [Mycena galopus ATCC 62051]
MVQITRFFTLLAVVSVGLAASVKRSTVEAALQTVSSDVAALSGQIAVFAKASSIQNAAVMESGCLNLIKGIDAANAAATSDGPFTDEESNSLLNSFQALLAPTQNALRQLINAHPGFDTLKLEGAVCLTVHNLQTSTTGLGNTMIKQCPTQQARAQALNNAFSAAGDSTIATYCH